MHPRVKVTRTIEKAGAMFPCLIGLYGLYYNRLVEQEVAAAQISAGDRVLCIGGGPLPYTALRIHTLTGAHVTVMDNDRSAVEMASRLVEKMGLANKLSVRFSDGQGVNAADFSVVHIALQVSPREQVLENIRTTAPKGVRVLMRSPAEAGAGQLARRWLVNRVKQRRVAVDTTFVLRSKPEVVL
ncbi:SAM-dependent methyltransferase [Dethiobacter alkaliphilus]|uniref:Nicotianamine synthase n=1 Tax=Dethiobacter alkaliphilus AHT 1 TaxID=555088 RepID=C0GC66_DETAL|nr:nicotianamine synthase family protein [Dethiobacter alkaliphilus]EEG78801.1 hypothetical protein DealDRAFT_0075 [Dethiobacter alkaliphilus AHT 1]